MDTQSVVVQIVVFWLVCGFVGGVIGNAKQAPVAGFLLGLLLGPLGIVAAFMVDGRSQCPQCAGRLNSGAKLCHHCGERLAHRELEIAKSDDMTREEQAIARRRRQGGLPPRAE